LSGIKTVNTSLTRRICSAALRTEFCHKNSVNNSYLIIIIDFTNKQDDILTIFTPNFNNKYA
jgi:hypothetical protein